MWENKFSILRSPARFTWMTMNSISVDENIVTETHKILALYFLAKK